MKLLFLAVSLACAACALAQPSSPLDQRLKKLEEELRCLVCQNQSLADSSAPLAEDLRREVRELAVAAFELAGCSGLARCDFFVEPTGEVLVNEVNTMPGFTETSVFGKLFEASGVSYPELCDSLVSLAVERYEHERGYEH